VISRIFINIHANEYSYILKHDAQKKAVMLIYVQMALAKCIENGIVSYP